MDLTKQWTEIASKMLLGKKIVKVRYMTDDEANEMGWDSKPIVLQLDDGNIVYPSMDDEGNNGGALFTNDDDNDVIPVIGVGA